MKTIERNVGTAVDQNLTHTPVFAKMRCPKCDKLYSVNVDVLAAQIDATTPQKFHCEACQSKFSVLPETFSLEGFVDTKLEIEDLPLRGKIKPGDSGGRRQAFENIPLATRECPKCHTIQAISAVRCRACDLIFSRYQPPSEQKRVAQEIELSGSRELVMLWQDVSDDYLNEAMHERFIYSCVRAGSLAFAASKYAKIIEASPEEDIAKRMRRRIMGLASQSFETSEKVVIRAKSFPSFTLFLILLGATTLFIGLFAPQTGLSAVGVAMMALSVGVHFVLRRSR